MYPFKFLLDGTNTLDPDLIVYAIVSGTTIEDYSDKPLEVKRIIKESLIEWLDLAENKTKKQNLGGDVDINDFEGLMDESMERILAKHCFYDLDIYILPSTTEWVHADNILDTLD